MKKKRIDSLLLFCHWQICFYFEVLFLLFEKRLCNAKCEIFIFRIVSSIELSTINIAHTPVNEWMIKSCFSKTLVKARRKINTLQNCCFWKCANVVGWLCDILMFLIFWHRIFLKVLFITVCAKIKVLWSTNQEFEKNDLLTDFCVINRYSG